MDIERFAALRRHRLLATLDDEQFQRIARTSQLVELEAGQMLFQRGAEARHFYVVLSGQVKLCLQSRGGDEKIVEMLTSGQPFAEALMFAESPAFPLAAIAVEASTVAAIANTEYLAILRSSTETCLRLLADLSRRLHVHIREIEALALENSTNRLVNYLLGHAGLASGAADVTLDESKQTLAARLAIKPETLSRMLRALADAGVIRVDGRHIHIPDLNRLRQRL
jgi:CRP-like cAMP-binding protein